MERQTADLDIYMYAAMYIIYIIIYTESMVLEDRISEKSAMVSKCPVFIKGHLLDIIHS